MDVKEFAISNLGKSIEQEELYYSDKGMVVGYFEPEDAVIISFPDDRGWGHLYSEDTILLHSPLNMTYLYMYLDDFPKYWRIKE